MTVEVRPSIPADFETFIDRPLPYRVKALTGLVDSEIVAVGGIAFLPDGAHGAFLMANETARKYPITLHKAGLRILREAKALGILKLAAIADTDITAAERWLGRFGFEPVTVGGKEVWLWQQSSA